MKRNVVAWTILLASLALGCGRDSAPPPDAGKTPDAASASPPGDLDSTQPDRPSPPRGPMARKYEVTLVSRLTMQGVDGKAQAIEADAWFVYTWQCRPGERVLVLHSQGVKVTIDGRAQTEGLIERSRFRWKQGFETTDVPFEKAPPEIQNMLRDSYETPLCRLTVDDRGNVTGETVTAGPGAEAAVKNGAIANCRLLHPPFRRGKRAWMAPAKVSMGDGNYAAGELTYQAGPAVARGEAAGRIPVDVSGTLTGGGTVGPTGIRNARYVVRGSQTFDPGRGRWVDGSLTLDTSFDTHLHGKKIASNSGTMKASLKWLGSTELEPAPDADSRDEAPKAGN